MPHRRNKLISLTLCFLLLLEQTGFAQTVSLNLSNYLSQAPKPAVSDTFRPLHLRYLSYDNSSNNFQLLLDKGSSPPDSKPLPAGQAGALEQVTQELLKYFFIGLSLSNDKFWVNLRPDSPDDILDDDLAKTDIGRIFLEADVQLKKDTAGLTSPQTKEGKEYWDKLYKKAGELFGSENITIPTLTRPWIVPDEVILRESPEGAYIYKATLKVMLEEDYLSRGGSRTAPTYQQYTFSDPRLKELNEYSTQLIKESIIPRLTKEINSARRYAPLRQVYYSLILAQWFKQSHQVKRSQSHQLPQNPHIKLIDSGKLITPNFSLLAQQPYDKQAYFKQYQQSFQDGEYNLQEPAYTPMGQNIRRYMSGGVTIVSSPFIIKGQRFVNPIAGNLKANSSINNIISMAANADMTTSASSPSSDNKEIQNILRDIKLNGLRGGETQYTSQTPHETGDGDNMYGSLIIGNVINPTLEFTEDKNDCTNGYGPYYFERDDFSFHRMSNLLMDNSNLANKIVLKKLDTIAGAKNVVLSWQGVKDKDLNEILLAKRYLADVFNSILDIEDFYREINAENHEPLISYEMREVLKKVRVSDPTLKEKDYLRLNRALLEVIYPQGMNKPIFKRVLIKAKETGGILQSYSRSGDPEGFYLSMAKKEKEKNNLENWVGLDREALYGGDYSILSVIVERPWHLKGTDYWEFEMEKDSIEESLEHSMIFVAKLSNIKSSNNDSLRMLIDMKGEDEGPIEMYSLPLTLDKIEHILVSQKFASLAQEIFNEHNEKIMVVKNKRKVDITTKKYSRIKVECPDYEAVLEQICNSNPGVKFWAHGLRLPTKDDSKRYASWKNDSRNPDFVSFPAENKNEISLSNFAEKKTIASSALLDEPINKIKNYLRTRGKIKKIKKEIEDIEEALSREHSVSEERMSSLRDNLLINSHLMNKIGIENSSSRFKEMMISAVLKSNAKEGFWIPASLELLRCLGADRQTVLRFIVKRSDDRLWDNIPKEEIMLKLEFVKNLPVERKGPGEGAYYDGFLEEVAGQTAGDNVETINMLINVFNNNTGFGSDALLTLIERFKENVIPIIKQKLGEDFYMKLRFFSGVRKAEVIAAGWKDPHKSGGFKRLIKPYATEKEAFMFLKQILKEKSTLLDLQMHSIEQIVQMIDVGSDRAVFLLENYDMSLKEIAEIIMRLSTKPYETGFSVVQQIEKNETMFVFSKGNKNDNDPLPGLLDGFTPWVNLDIHTHPPHTEYNPNFQDWVKKRSSGDDVNFNWGVYNNLGGKSKFFILHSSGINENIVVLVEHEIKDPSNYKGSSYEPAGEILTYREEETRGKLIELLNQVVQGRGRQNSYLNSPSTSSAAKSVQDRMKAVIRKIHPFIKGAGSFNDWQKGDDPFIISRGTIIKRAEVMLGERGKKTSLHLGSGGSVLPIVDALLGFSVIVTDLNMTAMRDVITIADKLQQEIKDAGGEIIFRELDLLKLIGEARYLIAPEQEEFVKEILSKNSVGHVTMTNVFNWAGDILSRHKERICIAILSLLKKSGGTFTISSDMVIGQENFFDELIGVGNKYVEIELGGGTVVPYSFILYNLQEKLYSAIRGDDNTTNSSSAASDDKGGIDLSRINKSIRAESVSSSAFSGGNSPVDVDFNVNEELIQLQKLLNAQIIPSADRLNRYARAARASFASSPESADSAISLVAETFRLQEEKAVSAPTELKTLAAWLEQGP